MISLKKSPHAILQSFNSVSQCTQQVLDWALEQVWSRLDEIETSLEGCPQFIDCVTGALEELHVHLLAQPNDRKVLAVLSASIGQLYAIRFVLVIVLLNGRGGGEITRPNDLVIRGAFDKALAISVQSAQYDRLLAEEWLWQSVLFDPFGGSGIEGLRKLYIQTTIIGGSELADKSSGPTGGTVNSLIHSFGLKNLITGEVNFVDLREFDRSLLHLKKAKHLLSLNAALVSELSRISLFTGHLKEHSPPDPPSGIWPLIFLWILLRQFDGVGVYETSVESLLLFLSSLIKVLGNCDSIAPINTRFRPAPPPPTSQPQEDVNSPGGPQSAKSAFPSNDCCEIGLHTETCAHSSRFARTVVDFIYMMIANVDTDKVGVRVLDCESALLQLLEVAPPSSPGSSSVSSKGPPRTQNEELESWGVGVSSSTCPRSSVWTEEDDLMYYAILPALLCSCISVLPRTELKKRFAIGICLRRILRTLILNWNPENPLRLFLAMNGVFYLIQKDGFFQDLALTGCEGLISANASPTLLSNQFGSNEDGLEGIRIRTPPPLPKCRPLRATRCCELKPNTSLDSLTLEHRQAESRLLADALIQTMSAFPMRNIQFPATIAHLALPEDRWYYTHTANDLLGSPTCQGILQSDWIFDLVDSEAQLDSTQLRLIARAKKRVISKCAYTPSKRTQTKAESPVTQQHQEYQKLVSTIEECRKQCSSAEGVEFLISVLPNALSLCRLKLNSQSGDANERQYERERRTSLLLTLITNTLEVAAPYTASSSTNEKLTSAATVVIDVANVAISYGKQRWRTPIFDTEGVIKTINEIKRLGHHPICITSEEYVSGGARAAQVNSLARRFRVAENSESMLKQLHLDGELELTPPGDYDDGYILSFAMKKNACVLSNDKFRDQIPIIAERSVRVKMRNHNHVKIRKCSKCMAELKREVEATKTWLKRHLISYAFLGDDVIINPAFVLPLG